LPSLEVIGLIEIEVDFSLLRELEVKHTH